MIGKCLVHIKQVHYCPNSLLKMPVQPIFVCFLSFSLYTSLRKRHLGSTSTLPQSTCPVQVLDKQPNDYELAATNNVGCATAKCL